LTDRRAREMQLCHRGSAFRQLSSKLQEEDSKTIRVRTRHRRAPQSEVDRLLFRTRGKTGPQRKEEIRSVGGGAKEQTMAGSVSQVTKLKIRGCGVGSVLLDHYLSGFNDGEHSVTLVELQLVSTAPGDSTLDQIVAYAHDHVRHDITQLNFFDFSTELVSG
jgi:hypothetical protein